MATLLQQRLLKEQRTFNRDVNELADMGIYFNW